MVYIVIALSFAFAGGFVGRIKGSSFVLWFIISGAFPFIGLAAALLYRFETEELRRRCPVCGNVGVALGTSGPGATNLVTPIMDAMMDSVPVVFITGQVRTDLLGTDGFQEADIMGITMPAVKHSWMIQHPLEIPRVLHEAFHVARTGRPGPVVVDIPTDLSRADIPYEPVTDVHLPGYQPTTEGNTKQIRQAAKALASARRPVLYVDSGVVNAATTAALRHHAEQGP